MAASLFFIGRKKGVERPALVGLLPACNGPVVCLDIGANADCKPEHLCQFAHMGVEYARETLRLINPTVGLLSNGEESSKGSALTKQAFVELQKSGLNFIGNIEPGDVFQNKVDIVVCDGFAGNIFLKTFEAVLRLFGTGGCASAKEILYLEEQGGALLLGVKKPTIIVHGNASARVVERAILFAHQTVLDGDNYGRIDKKNIAVQKSADSNT
jgi:glycerol-3-phosphate acyltransferase PlsX